MDEPKICSKFLQWVEPILLAFLSLHMVESRLSNLHYLQSKQRSILNIECGDLWFKLTNLQPNIHDLISAHQIYPSH